MRRTLLVAFALSFSLPACTTDTSADTDTDTESGSSGDTSGAPTTMEPTTAESSSGSTSTGGETSTSGSSSSGADESSSSGGADESSTGEEGQNICHGFNALGLTGEVSTDGTAMGEPVCTLEPAPCQGELVGTWTVEDSCGYEVLPNFFAEICESATQQITGTSASGTRTFADDGTFEFEVVLQLEADLQVDSMACLGVDCETFGNALSEEPGLEMVCEDGDAGSCNCFYTADLPQGGSGTWDIFDDSLLLTSDEGEVVGLLDYCVENGRLSTWMPLYDNTPFPDTTCVDDEDCEGQVEGEFDAIGCDPPEEDER